MAFEGLKDRLKEQWAELSAKVQETSAFNTLREKYESQTPTVQKAILGGIAALVVLFLLSFPLGYLSTSSDNLTAFEENRSLIQGLLRASRTAKEPSPIPPPIDPMSLRSMVERVMHEKKLVPEQMGEMLPIPGDVFRGTPAGVVVSGLAVQIKHLNLQQIIDLGTSFQNLGPGTKLVGMDIVQTTGQDHYYDMVARVANFGLPPPDLGPDPAEAGGRGGRGAGAGGRGGAKPPPRGNDTEEE